MIPFRKARPDERQHPAVGAVPEHRKPAEREATPASGERQPEDRVDAPSTASVRTRRSAARPRRAAANAPSATPAIDASAARRRPGRGRHDVIAEHGAHRPPCRYDVPSRRPSAVPDSARTAATPDRPAATRRGWRAGYLRVGALTARHQARRIAGQEEHQGPDDGGRGQEDRDDADQPPDDVAGHRRPTPLPDAASGPGFGSSRSFSSGCGTLRAASARPL